MDCSFLIFQSHLGMIVPWPEIENRVLASIKPFQLPVGFYMLAQNTVIYSLITSCKIRFGSGFFVTCILMLFPLVWIPGMYLKYVSSGQNDQPVQQINLMNSKSFGNAAVYILTILLSQGNKCQLKRSKITQSILIILVFKETLWNSSSFLLGL